MTSERDSFRQDWLGAMRRDWNQRAREKARYFIATDVPDSEEAFFASGRVDYDTLVRPFLARRGFAPAGKVALEIGCGVGRLTRVFAEEFAEVIGVDISSEMLERAKSYQWPRARFVCGNGADLGGVPDASVDFAFSYIVFQHIPEKALILRYVEDVGRVLRPGGIFRLHMNGLPHVRLGEVLLEGYVSDSPKLRKLGLQKMPFVRRRHLGTWLGHPVSLAGVRRACRRGGLALDAVEGRWSVNMWAEGTKPLRSAAG